MASGNRRLAAPVGAFARQTCLPTTGSPRSASLGIQPFQCHLLQAATWDAGARRRVSVDLWAPLDGPRSFLAAPFPDSRTARASSDAPVASVSSNASPSPSVPRSFLFVGCELDGWGPLLPLNPTFWHVFAPSSWACLVMRNQLHVSRPCVIQQDPPFTARVTFATPRPMDHRRGRPCSCKTYQPPRCKTRANANKKTNGNPPIQKRGGGRELVWRGKASASGEERRSSNETRGGRKSKRADPRLKCVHRLRTHSK